MGSYVKLFTNYEDLNFSIANMKLICNRYKTFYNVGSMLSKLSVQTENFRVW